MTGTFNRKREYNEDNGTFLQEDQLCELWKDEQVEKPPHSRLFHLEPIGVGSPFVESLTSYVTRLAEAHSISLRTLISQEIVPLLKHSYLSRRLDEKGYIDQHVLTLFWRECKVINGLTSWTEDWVEALERLTLRQDLRFLTMLSWKYVFSSRHLVRQTQQWCPFCYEEWRLSGSVIYQPLLWSLQSIRTCPQHNILLQQQCPHVHCGYKLLMFYSRVQAGYCPKCNQWLGASRKEQRENLRVQTEGENQQSQQLEHMVGKLLAFAPELIVLPRQEVIRETIIAYTNKTAGGYISQFTRHYQISRPAVRDWLQQGNLPCHSGFLRVCLSLGIDPVFWLTGNLLKMIATQEHPWKGPSVPIIKPKRRKYKQFDAENVERALKTILASPESLIPSMEQVAKSLDYSHGLLSTKFPELCQAISTRHREEKKKQLEIRDRKALEDALQSSENFPLSMSQIAKSLGYSQLSPLSERYPELCHAISTRYIDALKKLREEHIQKAIEEVRQAILYFHEQGIYPSSNKVQEKLTSPWSLTNSKVRAFWKETLKELECL